jgi:hypothetical protein
MTVVVFSVGSRAGKNDISFLAPSQRVMIDESPVIVAIETFQGEGHAEGGLFEGFKGPELSPVFEGYGLCPLGTDVR